jgi:probable HAF family extracellular repeat protein
MADLGTLGGQTSQAFAINTRGEVVGCATAAGDADGWHAFQYRDGVMMDLNDLISATSDWILRCAYAINESGQIAGLGQHRGEERAFLLTPRTMKGRSARGMRRSGTGSVGSRRVSAAVLMAMATTAAPRRTVALRRRNSVLGDAHVGAVAGTRGSHC